MKLRTNVRTKYSRSFIRGASAKAAVDETPITIWEANPVPTGSNSNTGFNFRGVCTLTGPFRDQFRVSILPGGVPDPLTSDHVGVGKWNGDASHPSLAAPIIELLFNNAGGFANQGTEQVSDWMDSGILKGVTDFAVISFNTGGSGQNSTAFAGPPVNCSMYFNASSGNWNVQDVSAIGYTSTAFIFGIVKIETRYHTSSDSGIGYIPSVDGPPLSQLDGRFVSNITQGVTSMIAGQTLTNKTITDASATGGQAAGVMMTNNTTMRDCIVDNDEAVRVSGGTYNIVGCWLEATGVGEDHADVIQAYSGSRERFVIRITDTIIVAHDIAATAGLFTADDCTGDIYLNNVVFMGGPYGMKIHADAGGDTRLFLNNVYFVGPFGSGPYTTLDFNGGVVIAAEWNNVRWATIVDGQLVPGDLISPP